jgi:hypothetical protein
MSQLTSIQALRNSPALQYRVENVMQFLQRLNPNWQANWWFPIGIIRVSNGSDDCTWVRQHTSTHHKGVGSLVISGVTVKAEDVINALKNVQANDEERLSNFVDALAPLGSAGQILDWKDGMITAEDAAAQVPFDQQASTPAPAKKAAKKSASPRSSTAGAPAVKPIATKTAKPTKLDEVKKLFNDLTPKQKVEMQLYALEKVNASTACQAFIGVTASATVRT